MIKWRGSKLWLMNCCLPHLSGMPPCPHHHVGGGLLQKGGGRNGGRGEGGGKGGISAEKGEWEKEVRHEWREGHRLVHCSAITQTSRLPLLPSPVIRWGRMRPNATANSVRH